MKSRLILTPLLIASLLFASNTASAETTFYSPESKATLVELYTSEGCSSCPPADQWLSKLNSHEELWKNLFPVAFHVDYWDYLGWKDKFSQQQFSQRQYAYQRAGAIGTVYTPGMVRNGREWRSWRWSNDPVIESDSIPGVLILKIDAEILHANFDARTTSKPLILHVALLGMNRTTRIKSGENEGKTLKHDFVVLDLIKHKQSKAQWTIRLPTEIHNTDAIVAWVTDQTSPTPIQVTGGLLQ